VESQQDVIHSTESGSTELLRITCGGFELKTGGCFEVEMSGRFEMKMGSRFDVKFGGRFDENTQLGDYRIVLFDFAYSAKFVIEDPPSAIHQLIVHRCN